MENDIGKTSDKFAELRKRAQVFLSATPSEANNLSAEDVRKLVHELDTYQIELELQNEDLRKAQADIEQSRSLYSDLYDFAPVGYITISGKGLIASANLTAADMLGEKRSHLLKQPFSKFICEEDQDIHYHCRKKLLGTKDPQKCNLRIQKKDGSRFDAQIKTVVNPDVDGTEGQFRVTIEDITEHKKLEKAIVQSKMEWELSFDAMNDIVTLMDKELRIIRANNTAHKFFKVKPGELNGKFCYELFRGASTPCLECPITKAVQSTPGRCYGIVEHKHLRKIFQISSSQVNDQNGEMKFLVHVARDITEQKKLEENLFQSHKMEAMGTLAGGIAHDFNNILSAIIGYASLIDLRLPKSSNLKDDITQVLNAGNRARELVKQILVFSRKKYGQKITSLEPQVVVKEVCKMLRSSLPTTIELKEDIDPECDNILADPTKLHQVIVNLCTNAFHSLKDEKGVITIQLSNKKLGRKEIAGEPDIQPGQFVELVVKDTGCGIEKQTLKHIFEPYYTTKEVGKGSGIGLAVVHGIVKSYGGMIQVESEAGKGSTFRVYFPSTEKQHKVIDNHELETLPSGTERILLVDDEKLIVHFMKRILSRLGYSVVSYTQSSEALDDFISRPDEFDLVITDQTMPNMPGTELSKKLCEVRPDLPVMLCTGYSSMVNKNTAKNFGIKRFLMKPVMIHDLAKNVREILDEAKS